MQRKYPFVYVPAPLGVSCPYPLVPLTRTLRLRLLGAEFQGLLYQAQMQANLKPMPPIHLDPLVARAKLDFLGAGSGAWRIDQKNRSHLIPAVVVSIVERDHMQRTMSLRRALDTALTEEFRKRGTLHSLAKMYDVFAIWHGIVQGKPHTIKEVDRAMAQVDCLNLVEADGTEAAQAIAVSICNAIEDKHSQDNTGE